MSRCTRPPKGWVCNGAEGHDGPCAAHPPCPICGHELTIGTRHYVESFCTEYRDVCLVCEEYLFEYLTGATVEWIYGRAIFPESRWRWLWLAWVRLRLRFR